MSMKRARLPLFLVALTWILVGCAPVDKSSEQESAMELPSNKVEISQSEMAREQAFAEQRQRMVQRQMRQRDISNERVLEVMARVPRHKFVPIDLESRAYDDGPLPIGHRQTISQPYIVALMTQLVDPQANHRALDIGTGSGYQTAVLSELVEKVFSIEIVEPLALEANQRLQDLGYKNVSVRAGDGYQGWPDESPFDVIIVAAAPDHIPQPLVEQLAVGGKMVIPVGGAYQELLLIEKLPDGSITESTIAPVAFVPMTGEAQK
ncbi:MAG TPA: protein-L-isoaspartate(D-aspartate) O-methyltransferase [Pirellulaceae bacterium]|nr:protein-L-isoaspartate(D-aspartate) O-methyltransferase [Pirellulaceae bacterium]HMO91215.1 protein-L-isoaspartate(D-aspartate) O-methyltransferase [Pirellulaceae bacterium]HMP70798.1 protein-L-isoaspartate(D-aspartate) O-methyltransferase [Pirellulaceae bacterium]